MLHAVVFDFDGVIVNSEPLHLRAFQSVLGEERISLSAREYYARYVGLSDADVFEAVARDRGLSPPEGWLGEVIARKTASVKRMLDEDVPLFPAAADRIRALAGEVPLAVASGALRPEILQVLDRAGLTGCFTAIVAAGETPRSKPAPDPYLAAVRRLSEATGRALQARQVVAVEDTLQGLESARTAGLRTLAVSTTYPASALGSADLVVADIAALTVEVVRRIAGERR